MTGVPVAMSSSSRAICAPCRSRVAVEQPSPVRATVSPMTATTQSAASAQSRTASVEHRRVGCGRLEQRWPGLAVRVGGAGRVGDQVDRCRRRGRG